MALDRHENFISALYLENKWIEFHQIVLGLGLLPPIFCLFVAE